MKKLITALLTVTLALPLTLNGQILKNNRLESQIDSICQEVFTEWNMPGMAVTVVKDGEIVLLKGYGMTSYEKDGTEISPDTQFVIASTSKAMTAALLATLVQRGDLTWNDTVVNHLPDFQLYDPWVTQNFLVKDIMVHKTGFRAYAADDLPHFGYNRDEIYSILKHIRPTYSFRTTYAYNNAMYTVAAKLIEKYYGMSWDEAIKEYLFKPLGMTSSSTGNVDYFNNKRVAKGYRHFKEGDSITFAPRLDTLRGFSWLSAVAPAGFVITTGRDMANWLKMHLGKGSLDGKVFLEEREHNSLIAPQTITGRDTAALYNYAQGWTIEQGLNGRMVRHTGLAYGYTALVTFFPELDMGISIITNAGNTTNPHMAIAREVAELVTGVDNRDWRKHYLDAFMRSAPSRRVEEKADSLPPQDLKLYIGEYYKDDFGTASVTMQEGKLHFALKKIEVPLSHKSGNIFIMSVPGAGNIEVEFFEGDDKKSPIESLTFSIGDPIGKFYRKSL